MTVLEVLMVLAAILASASLLLSFTARYEQRIGWTPQRAASELAPVMSVCDQGTGTLDTPGTAGRAGNGAEAPARPRPVRVGVTGGSQADFGTFDSGPTVPIGPTKTGEVVPKEATMAVARTVRMDGLDWPPESLRRFLDADWSRGSWLRVEEFRDGDDLVLRAELPDIDPDKDVEVTVSDGVLHIHAERRQASEITERSGYRSEFRYGSFTRDFVLPDRVKADDVKASYHKGILEVHIPLPASKSSSVKAIPVTSG